MDADWYEGLKNKLVLTRVNAMELRSQIVLMILTNKYVTTDVNLAERMAHIVDAANINIKDIEELSKFVKETEKHGNFFLVEDLVTEIDYIEENCSLGVGYFTNMIEYMKLVEDTTINGDTLLENFEKNYDNSMRCYDQININQKELKKLKKGRKI